MIIVAAHVTVKQGKQKEFIAAANICVQQTRKEQGQITYRLMADVENDCVFMFFEEWETMEYLEAHMRTAHFAALGDALRDVVAAPPVVSVYEGKKLQ